LVLTKWSFMLLLRVGEHVALRVFRRDVMNKNRRRFWIVFTALLVLYMLGSLLVGPAHCQEVTVTSVVKGAYLGPDGAVWYRHPLLQSDILVAWDNGVYADLWVSTSGNTRKDWDKETDVTLGYGRKFRRVNYSVEGVYFAVMDGDILHGKLELSVETPKVSPFVRVMGFVPTRKGGPKEGVLLVGGLRTSFSPSKLVEVSLEGSVRHDSGAFGYDPGWHSQGKVGVGVTLTSKTQLLLGVELAHRMSKVTDGRKGEVVWEIGLSHRFK